MMNGPDWPLWQKASSVTDSQFHFGECIDLGLPVMLDSQAT
jgi:hypothetical protein